MLTKKHLVIALAILVAIAGSCWLATRDTSPTYEGKHAREWFRQYVVSGEYPSDDDLAHLEAKVALKQMGRTAIELLIYEACHPRPDTKWAEIRHDLHTFFSGDSVGPYVSGAGVAAEAENALREIRPPSDQVLPVLRQQLSHPENVDDYVPALRTLGCIGNGAEQAIPFLVAALDSKNQPLHLTAATALANLGPKAKSAATALTNCLDHCLAASECCLALAAIGSDAAAAQPVLNQLLQSAADSEHQLAFALPLISIDPAHTNALSIVRSALLATNPPTSDSVAYALKLIGPSAKLFVPELLRVSSPEGPVGNSGTAIATLQVISPRDAIAVLRTNFHSALAIRNRINFAGHILQIDPMDAVAVSDLRWIVEDPVVTVDERCSALDNIGEASPDNKAAVALLNQYINSSEEAVRTAAQRGLKRMRLRQLDRPRP